MKRQKLSPLALLTLLFALAACGGGDGNNGNNGSNNLQPDAQSDTSDDTDDNAYFVAPVYEPQGQVPLPNDLALEEDGTLPPTSQSDANPQFAAWYDLQTGWLKSESIRVAFDGPLDESTVSADNVLVFRLGEDGAEPVALDAVTYAEVEGGSMITAMPSEPLAFGEAYMSVVTTDILAAGGEPIVPALAIDLAASAEALTAEDVPESAPLDAEAYEALRQQLEPLFEAAAAQDIERGQIAAISGWTTRAHVAAPEAVDGVWPMPIDLALDEDGTYPEDDSGVTGARAVLEEYRGQLHGWPGNQTISLPLEGMPDDGSLNEESVELWQTEQGADSLEPVELDSVEVDDEDGTIVIHPRDPLSTHEQYYATVTTDATDEQGRSLSASVEMFLAMQPDDLVDANGSVNFALLDGVSSDYLEAIQQLRDVTRPAVQKIQQAGGHEWQELAAVWTWSTLSDPIVANDVERMPSPHDIMLDDDGTFPSAALDHVGEPSAQGYFEEYLDSLHGFSPETPMALPLRGRVDPATVTADALQVWMVDQGDGSWTRVEEFSVSESTTDGDQQLDVVFDEARMRDEYFVVFATRDISASDGTPLAADLPLVLAIQPNDISEGDPVLDEITGDQAQLVLALRPLLRPLVEQIEAETSLSWRDLATVWSWHTWTDTFVLLDPATGEIPFPNAFLMENDRVSIPTAGATGLELALFNEVNGRHGFSTVSASWVPLAGGIDETTLNNQSILIPLIFDYEVEYRADSGHLLVRYNELLDAESSVAAAIKPSVMGTDGNPVKPSPVWVYLESPYELTDEQGESLVETLDNDSAAQLEAGRQAFQEYFDAMSFLNLSREDIAMGWTYSTGRTTRPLQNLRAQALYALAENGTSMTLRRACEAQSNCSPDLNLVSDPGSLSVPDTPGVTADMSNIATIQFAAEYDTTLFFDDSTGTLRDLEQDPSQTIPEVPVGVSVFVPEQTQTGGECAPPFDVVLGIHGVTISRNQFGVTMANDLAAFPNCLATVAFDMPLHGGRAPGVTDLHISSTPMRSGEGFLGLEVGKTKAIMMQTVADLFVLAQIANNDGLETAIDADPNTDFFTTNVALAGRSMGGIMGALFVTVEPLIDVAALNVAGGRFPAIIEDSRLTAGLLTQLPDPSDFEYTQTLELVQWALEHVDPLVFAPHTVQSPVDEFTFSTTGGQSSYSSEGAVPANQVLLQMVDGDPTVPNRATQAMADAMGESLQDSTFPSEAGHNITWVHDPADPGYDAAVCARAQIAAWLSSGLQTGTSQLPADLAVNNCLTP